MDFFERQYTARRNTKWLLLYYPMAVVAIIGNVYWVAAFVWSRGSLWNPGLFAAVAGGTLLLILGTTLVKMAQLRQGGGVIARSMGGVPLDTNTRDPDERKLLNVVEEMAIASGTPVPGVWVLRDEPGINAFAEGHDMHDAAIGVTQGAMKHLSRDELQGVIAHEFSHILHGDVRLNVRVLGLLQGILIIALIGRILMRIRGGRKNPMPLVGLALFVIGWAGFVFGQLIKSAVSRQREYLADSAAVQFTRNPLGLAGALKKIGGFAHGSMMLSGHAEEASHFLFANGVSGFWANLMSTHPPLAKRIRLLDPQFDGKYPKTFTSPSTGKVDLKSDMTQFVAQAVHAERLLDHAGAPTSQHLAFASDFRDKLPRELFAAAHEPAEAVALVFALLLAGDPQARAVQLQQLHADAERTRKLAERIDPLPVAFRLPLLSLALPALKRLSPKQYDAFSKTIETLVACDKQIDLFEYALKKIVSRHLDPHFRPERAPTIKFYSLRPLLPDCVVLISALARLGHADLPPANMAFMLGMKTLSPEATGYTLLNLTQCGLTQIDEVLTRFSEASPGIKHRVLLACAHAVAADNVVQAEEAELLRAIADTLACPIPPFIQGVT